MLVRVPKTDPRIARHIDSSHFLATPKSTALKVSDCCFWMIRTENGELIFQDSSHNHRKLMKQFGIKWGKKAEQEPDAAPQS